MTPQDEPKPKLKRGYNVWFGLQHVTLTGFRHSGRREACPKCNPTLGSATDQGAGGASDVDTT